MKHGPSPSGEYLKISPLRVVVVARPSNCARFWHHLPVLGPLITGNLVVLRPPAADDLVAISAWFRDPEVMRFAAFRWMRDWGATDEVPSVEELARWMEQSRVDRRMVLWAVEADGHLVGVAAIADIYPHHLSARSHTLIGDRRYWGRGLGSEVVALRTRYAFEVMGLHKLKTATAADNHAMRRALEKSGYRIVGIERQDALRNGKWCDTWLGELLRDEWEPN